ncbi:Sas10 C-terminal domain-containing protein [Kalaharituber pfeilii]|nr:Sas10 C-terminal domain-containing protein [Kalaharituber pfeilii]
MGRSSKRKFTSKFDEGIRSRPIKAPKEFDPEDSTIAPINSYTDVADEVDDFHLQRDKVLLEDIASPTASNRHHGRRGGRSFSDSDNEEEVYALSQSESDSDEDDDDLEDYASSAEEVDEENHGDEAEDTKKPTAAQKPKRPAKPGALSDSDDDSNEDGEDEIEGWGTSKSAYYGGDELTTDQDALDEEAEARWIQKKQLSTMTESDFLPDIDDWTATDEIDSTTSMGKKAITTTETLPTAIPENLSPAERMKLLRLRNPEFEPLAKEFVELHEIYPEIARAAAAAAQNGVSEMAIAKHRALSIYLGVLAMYFALMSAEEEGRSRVAVKEHKVMEGLVRCRELWGLVKGLQPEEQNKLVVVMNGKGKGVDGDMEMEDVDEMDEVLEDENKKEPIPYKTATKKMQSKATGKAAVNGASKPSKQPESKPNKRLKLDTITTAPTTTKPKNPRLAATEASLASLSSLIPATTGTTSSKPKPSSKFLTSAGTKKSDFLDPPILPSTDSHEKQLRKHSLRFHATQLLSKSSKRASAARIAGGDADVPRKERLKDRQERLAAERAAKRNKGEEPGDDLSGEEWDASDTRVAEAVNGSKGNINGKEGDEDEDLAYYNSIAAQSALKKQRNNAGDVPTTWTEEELDESGKRAIGYTIEKNKGLTPHRKKEVRNPRVKKRKAFEKAKKKLRTVKKVYTPLQGAYGGEATGIKKNLVKSIKLK